MAEQNPTIVQASSIIESKLTKTEAIEIMVDDLVRELKRAQKNAEAEVKKLEKIPFQEVMHLFKNASISFNEKAFGAETDSYTITVEHVRINDSQMMKDARINDHARRLKEITKEASKLSDQLNKLLGDKTATKVALLKSILEGTPEGRDWLAQLDTIRHRAAKQFNISINPRILAGKL